MARLRFAECAPPRFVHAINFRLLPTTDITFLQPSIFCNMDPLSVSAGIIAVLQLSSTVFGYLKDATEATGDRKRLLDEVTSLHFLLFPLVDQMKEAEGDDTWSASLRSLKTPGGPLEQFRVELQRVASKLERVAGVKKFGKAITWPFQKEEVKEILSTIERQKSLFILALESCNM